MIVQPGIHRNIPAEAYHALPAASSGVLRRLLAESPAHSRVPFKESEALIIGSALHAATLEPETLESLYYFPGVEKLHGASKEGKAQKAEAVLAAGSRAILWRDEAEQIEAMQRAIIANESARNLLDGSEREVTLLWHDPETGAACKARIDILRRCEGGSCFLADIKTTAKSATPPVFSRTSANLRYHAQAAWYMEAAKACGLRPQEFFFLAIEKAEPYGSVVYQVDETALRTGADENRRALATWQQCNETGVWPGYTHAIQSLTLPRYYTGNDPWQISEE